MKGTLQLKKRLREKEKRESVIRELFRGIKSVSVHKGAYMRMAVSMFETRLNLALSL